MHRKYFFGTQKGINKPFFWVILPLVIVEDVVAVLGALFTILLYVLSFMTHDFTILLATLLFFTIIFSLQFGEDKHYRKFSYFVLAPIVWYLFHLITFVQIHALFKTLWTFYRKSEVKWQAWKRTGVADS
jgi:energy-coupling factor transporter transmembrane protein EcfT